MNAIMVLFQNPSWDMIAVFVFVASGFFFGVSYGKKALGMVIVGIYVLFSLWPFLPIEIVTSGRSPAEAWGFGAGIFFALLLLMLLFLFRAFRGALFSEGVWWEILILSILGAGLLITILLRMAPAEAALSGEFGLSPFVLKFFSDPFSFWWIILPILGVMFL